MLLTTLRIENYRGINLLELSLDKAIKSPEIQEERDNYFVAITRTIESLSLTCTKYCANWCQELSRFTYAMGLRTLEETE